MWTHSAPALRLKVSGTGDPVLLLLHEIGGSQRSWDRVVALLGDEAFSIVRYDQRGFGESEQPRTAYPPQALVDDALRVLDAAAIDGPVGIVAAAASCATAVALARHAPERVTKMVLCAPALGLSAEAKAAALARAERVVADGMAAIVDGAMASMYPEDIRDAAFAEYRARFLANDPVGFALASRAHAGADTTLDGLTTPLLLLAGTHDVRPEAAIVALASRAGRARVEIVVGAGHVMAVQRPDAVAAHIARFLGAAPDTFPLTAETADPL